MKQEFSHGRPIVRPKPFYKWKTFWAAIASILTAFGALMAGEVLLWQFLQIAVTSILAVFIRHGVARGR